MRLKYINLLLVFSALFFQSLNANHLNSIDTSSMNSNSNLIIGIDDSTQSIDVSMAKSPMVVPSRDYLLAMENDTAIVKKRLRLPKELYQFSKKVIFRYERKAYIKMRRKLNGFERFVFNNYFEGILLCASQKGIWVYSKNKEELRFVPYKVMKNIRMGMYFSRFMRNVALISAGGGFIGGLALAAEDPYFAPVFILGVPIITTLYAEFLTLWTSPFFLIRDALSKKHFFEFINKKSGLEFYVMVADDKYRYGNYIDIKSFKPLHNDSLKLNDTSQIIAVNSKNDLNQTFTGIANSQGSSSTVKNSDQQNTTNNQSNNSANGSNPNTQIKNSEIDKGDVKNANSGSLSSYNFKRADGKLEIGWMTTGFNSTEVNEQKLFKSIPYIRSNNYTKDELQMLNPSELQFLAFYMITADGYSFSNLNLNFSKSQTKLLKNLELYNNQALNSTDGVPTSALSLSDRVNLKVIFEILTGKTP